MDDQTDSMDTFLDDSIPDVDHSVKQFPISEN